MTEKQESYEMRVERRAVGMFEPATPEDADALHRDLVEQGICIVDDDGRRVPPKDFYGVEDEAKRLWPEERTHDSTSAIDD